MATIFDVPMSSPTIRFLLSFTIHASLVCSCCSCGRLLALLAKARHARRESVAIAQVHCVDARPRARQRTECAAMHGDEAREARIDFLASEFQRQRSGGACRFELPPAARGQAHL